MKKINLIYGCVLHPEKNVVKIIAGKILSEMFGYKVWGVFASNKRCYAFGTKNQAIKFAESIWDCNGHVPVTVVEQHYY